MKRFCTLFLLLALAVPAFGQTKEADSIRFPATVTPVNPAAISKLSGEQLYVIDSDVPILVVDSPRGIVNITEEVGPIRIRGRFVDGSTKSETRTFKGKQVYIIEAFGTGKVELLVIPVGVTKSTEVIRKPLDVYADIAPIPPPDPPTPPDPKPTPPKAKVAHLTFIGPTPATLGVVTDKGLRIWLKDRGVSVWDMADGDPQIVALKLADAWAKAGGSPCIILQDATGKVLDQARLTSVEATKVLVTNQGK